MIGSLKKAATYSSTVVVPSAQTGLTSLFGKVRGEPRRYNHLSFMTYYLKSNIVILHLSAGKYLNIKKKEVLEM